MNDVLNQEVAIAETATGFEPVTLMPGKYASLRDYYPLYDPDTEDPYWRGLQRILEVFLLDSHQQTHTNDCTQG